MRVCGTRPMCKHFNPRSPHGERRGKASTCTGQPGFQPTLPARGATSVNREKFSELQFQPTLPARGATLTNTQTYSTHCNFNPRSPHGERHDDVLFGFEGEEKFQPTLPARGATRRKRRWFAPPRFQPTLPARGATSTPTIVCSGATHFNPRSPHGERHVFIRGWSRSQHFNPRSPHGERRLTIREVVRHV